MNDAKEWFDKGNALYKSGKYEEANTCFNKAIEIDPQNAEAWVQKGFALRRLYRYEGAITCFDKAIEIQSQLEWAWHGKGGALRNLGRNEEAIRCHDEAIRINPQFASAWLGKGLALENLGRHEEEIACYDKAIEIDKLFAEAWYNKGRVQLKAGNAEEASKAFDKAHGINLNEYKYWSGWITSLYEGGELDRSLNICEKGVEHFKGKTDALKELFYQKGVILTKQGKSDEALIAFKEASKFGNKAAQRVINKLIEANAGWWEWWFSDIQSETYWKFTTKHLFLILLIVLHLSGSFYYFYSPPIKSVWGITLASLGGLSLIALLFISRKVLFGVVLIEILIAMLISPIALLFSNKIPMVSLKSFSEIWEIWLATIFIIVFVLFHRIIRRIKTPMGEIEMPELRVEPEISMPEPKLI
ncbi:MAG TPA: tetratricopeptide repeat protein [Candidatus Brocadiia bacterium]|nr:tetratricopeptide repeat protein [Candidatus Brocadiales bacterium]